MLIKYKTLYEKRCKKLLEECIQICGVFSSFFREGASNFDIFSSIVFSGRIILKHIENKKGSRGVWEHAPPENFENLRTIVAILVFFEQFLGKFCLNFLPLNLSVSPNMMHFVPTFSIMLAL